MAGKSGYSKRVVLSSGLRAGDIRPPALMSEFKRLSIHDAAAFFRAPADLAECDCPACGCTRFAPAFTRYDWKFRACAECRSVYLSPRPAEAALERYYRESSAARYRIEHFTRDTARARRYHLLRSHADWMAQIIAERAGWVPGGYADWETLHPMIFEEVAATGCFNHFAAIDPRVPLNDSGLEHISTDHNNVLFSAVTALEKLEHQFSPFDFVNAVKDRLHPGGLFFFTTRTITGFDLQVLWDKTPYIFVPEHMNLLSIEGLGILVECCGLELVELSTPGQLDLELVRQAAQEDPAIELPAFVRYLLEERDALAHEDFQLFLQKHRLSSHVRVAAQLIMD